MMHLTLKCPLWIVVVAIVTTPFGCTLNIPWPGVDRTPVQQAPALLPLPTPPSFPAEAAPPPPERLTYVDAVYGFEIEAPGPGWRVDLGAQHSGLLRLSGPGREHLTVFHDSLRALLPLETYRSAWLDVERDRLAKAYPEATDIRAELADVPGGKAVLTRFTSADRSVARWTFVRGLDIFRIELVGTRADERVAATSDVIRSVRFFEASIPSGAVPEAYARSGSLWGFHQAARLWRESLRKQPDNGAAASSLAEALGWIAVLEGERNGNVQAASGAAEAALQRARTLGPEQPAVRRAEVLLLHVAQRGDEARRLGASLRSADEPWNLLVRALVEPDAQRQVELLDRARPMERAPVLIAFYVGRALEKKGESAPALKAYQSAVAQNPGLANGHYSMGRLLMDQRETLPQAVSALRRATQLDPTWANAYFNFAIAARRADRLQDAELAYRRVLALTPEDATAALYLGIAYRAMNRVQDAHRQYVRALNTNARLPETYYHLGRLYEDDLADPRGAAAYFQRFLQLTSGGPMAQEARERLTRLQQSNQMKP